MATQTQYVIPSPGRTTAINPGTTSRQWMTPQGTYVTETISGGGGGGGVKRPVVQTSG